MSERTYTVVGIYEDNLQRWCDSVKAASPPAAEGVAPEGVLVAGVFEGELSTVDQDPYPVGRVLLG